MLHIRHATPTDAEALRELYTFHLVQSPPEERDISLWRDTLCALSSNPDDHLLVGEEDGKAVSSVTLVVMRNLTHGLRPYSIIENVVTHADYRNRGYASMLIERASEIAKENGCYKIMLMTGSKKASTLRFYERCEFNSNEKTAFLKRL